MTHSEFKPQIDRLRTEWKYGYGPEKELVLYDIFKGWALETFREAVTELLANHKGGAPTADDISEILARLKAAQVVLAPLGTVICKDCNDTGAQIKTVGDTDYAVPCPSCPAGKRFAEKFHMKPPATVPMAQHKGEGWRERAAGGKE